MTKPITTSDGTQQPAGFTEVIEQQKKTGKTREGKQVTSLTGLDTPKPEEMRDKVQGDQIASGAKITPHAPISFSATAENTTIPSQQVTVNTAQAASQPSLIASEATVPFIPPDLSDQGQLDFLQGVMQKELLKAFEAIDEEHSREWLEKRSTTLVETLSEVNALLSAPIYLGNSSLEEAQIVCFTDNHIDENFRMCIGKTIDKYYQEGDVILVEGIESGKTVALDESSQAKWVTKTSTVQGWDRKDLTESVFIDHKAQKQALEEAIERFTTSMSAINEYNSLTKNNFEQALLSITNSYKNYSKYISFGNTDLEMKFNKKLLPLEECAKQFREVKLQNKGVLLYAVLDICSELKEETKYAIYEHTDEATNILMEKTFPERNDSLCNAIQKQIKPNQRVFVIAGALHFLSQGSQGKYESKQVKEKLNENKFVIVAPMKIFNTGVFSRDDNLDLKDQTNSK